MKGLFKTLGNKSLPINLSVLYSKCLMIYDDPLSLTDKTNTASPSRNAW